MIVRHAITVQHARQPIGRQQQRDELIDDRDRGVGGRREREQHGDDRGNAAATPSSGSSSSDSAPATASPSAVK